MEARHSEPRVLEGLSRFLVSHERCGAGFDIAHPTGVGSGEISMTCRGCGTRYVYASGPADAPPQVEHEPPEETLPAPVGPDQARPSGKARHPRLPPGRRPDRRAEADRTPVATAGRRPARSPAGAAVLLIAAAALTFAAIRIATDDEGQGSPRAALPAAPPAPRQGNPNPERKPPGAGRPAGGSAAPPAAPISSTPLLTSRYSVALPAGWMHSGPETALLLEPYEGSPTKVQIYYEHPSQLSLTAMAQKTAGYLRNRISGLTLSSGSRVEVAGAPGYELSGRGRGTVAGALGVLDASYRYLVVRTVASGASPGRQREAKLVETSFRPR